MIFRWHERAMAEAEAAAAFYQDKQPGLAHRFLDNLAEALHRIQRHPEDTGRWRERCVNAGCRISPVESYTGSGSITSRSLPSCTCAALRDAGKNTVNHRERSEIRKVMAAKQKSLDPIHPGEILREEFMRPLDISINRLARDIAVPPGRISAIVNGTRAISADTALRLGRYFGVSPESWMGLQADYDLRVAQRTVGAEVERRVHPYAA